MKKIGILLLVFVLTLSLAACSGGGKSSGGGTNTPEQSSKEEITFTEQTVVDNEQCTIKITGIEEDKFWGYSLKTYLENKSADTTYMFSLEYAAINGVQVTSLFATEVAPGKKSNESISFLDDDLENITGNFTDIELSFRVYDSENWEADDVLNTAVHVYPYGEEKASKFVRESKPTDNVLVDNENITAIITGYTNDALFGYTANLFLVNKTDRALMFTAEDVSVNGYMADPLFVVDVAAGKSTFTSMSWLESDFEENGITQVDSIELTLRAYESGNWTADDVFKQTFTVNP